MYRKVKIEEGEVEKELCLCSCILILFLAKTTFKLLEYCSVHISEFMMQGVGIVYKNVSFLSANCLCKYVLANIFWFSFILLSFGDVNGFIVTFNKGK